jgi:hypothetical protein
MPATIQMRVPAGGPIPQRRKNSTQTNHVDCAFNPNNSPGNPDFDPTLDRLACRRITKPRRRIRQLNDRCLTVSNQANRKQCRVRVGRRIKFPDAILPLPSERHISVKVMLPCQLGYRHAWFARQRCHPGFELDWKVGPPARLHRRYCRHHSPHKNISGDYCRFLSLSRPYGTRRTVTIGA